MVDGNEDCVDKAQCPQAGVDDRRRPLKTRCRGGGSVFQGESMRQQQEECNTTTASMEIESRGLPVDSPASDAYYWRGARGAVRAQSMKAGRFRSGVRIADDSQDQLTRGARLLLTKRIGLAARESAKERRARAVWHVEWDRCAPKAMQPTAASPVQSVLCSWRAATALCQSAECCCCCC